MRRKSNFRIGAIAVMVCAAGLAILWWHFNTHGNAVAVIAAQSGESQTSARGAKLDNDGFPVVAGEPTTNGSEGSRCDDHTSSGSPSIQNGMSIIPDSGTAGYGELEVQNGTREDAILSLYDPAADEKVREVYVQAGHSFRIKRIPEGTYQLSYSTGFDRDGHEDFRCDADYSQFERNFVYTEEKSHEGVQYHSITLTLQPVVGGNVRTKRISREEFLKGHH